MARAGGAVRATHSARVAGGHAGMRAMHSARGGPLAHGARACARTQVQFSARDFKLGDPRFNNDDFQFGE